MTKKKEMLSQNGNNKKRFQPHFRKFKNAKFTGHPQYVYDESGREYKVLQYRTPSFYL